MKLLLRAAFTGRRHLFLFFVTLATLLGLTTASQMEMFAIGVITDTLSSEKESAQNVLCEKFLSAKGNNPLDVVLYQIKKIFNFEHPVKAFLFLLLLVGILKAFFLFFSRYCTQILAVRISRDLRQYYFDHIQYQPMRFFQRYNIGTLSSRIAGDASQIAFSLNAFMVNYIQAPFVIFSTLIACFWMSWQLSIVIFLGLPLLVFPVIFLTRKVKRVARQLQKNQERFTSVLIDFLSGIQTVKIFSMEAFSFRKYQEQNIEMANLQAKTAKYDLLTRPILHLITTFCVGTVLIIGLYFLKMKVSDLIVFVALLNLFYEPIKKFAEENSTIQKGVIAAERMNEIFRLKPQSVNLPGATALKGFEDCLEFENVSFRYEDKWVLKNLSFKIKKGETVALVGKTGSGKSTLVQLIPRLYDIQKGSIRIDGKEVRNYTQQSLREQIAFVPQTPFLFYDTVRANISYGRPFSLKQIVEAAKKAHAHEFIKELPQKYDTLLSEKGKNLSGGQQQRLAIARALVKNAPILILDEATSALDAISENKIKTAIQELHGEITQILIAHRLSTIEYADRIIYLENGEKLAEGTKEELLATFSPFRQLWETHFQVQKKNHKSTYLNV